MEHFLKCRADFLPRVLLLLGWSCIVGDSRVLSLESCTLPLAFAGCWVENISAKKSSKIQCYSQEYWNTIRTKLKSCSWSTGCICGIRNVHVIKQHTSYVATCVGDMVSSHIKQRAAVLSNVSMEHTVGQKHYYSIKLHDHTTFRPASSFINDYLVLD